MSKPLFSGKQIPILTPIQLIFGQMNQTYFFTFCQDHERLIVIVWAAAVVLSLAFQSWRESGRPPFPSNPSQPSRYLQLEDDTQRLLPLFEFGAIFAGACHVLMQILACEKMQL